ncbi:MAG: UTP--glucose-1-phosphate uridylyltransferase [Dehalococcoidia bacterium]
MTGVLDEVDATIRDTLLSNGFDPALFERLRAEVGAGRLSPESNVVRGTIEPPRAEDITRLPEPGESGWDAAYERGAEAIRQGQVAMTVLNGGMATRFGGGVKGIVEAVDGRSFLEWKLAEAARVAAALGGTVPCLVMNSFATDKPTVDFLGSCGERGATLPQPIFFTQFVSLRLNRDGSLFRESDGRPSLYAPGHGDFPEALRRSGVLGRLCDRGVRQIMLSNVDNLGARVDPAVVGAHLLAARPITVEVTAKEPGDSGGAPARVDGRVIHLERFRFPPDFDQDSIPVFNTNSFVFDLEALEQDVALTWFYVEKSVEDRPAVQLERLVNELTSFLPTTFLQVPRGGPRGRFFPIKEQEDLPAAQPTLREMLAASVV